MVLIHCINKELQSVLKSCLNLKCQKSQQVKVIKDEKTIQILGSKKSVWLFWVILNLKLSCKIKPVFSSSSYNLHLHVEIVKNLFILGVLKVIYLLLG